MSLKKLDEVKQNKWFRAWDIIIYAVILIAAVALILAFTLGGDRSEVEGFYVAYKGERVLSFDFSEDSPKVLDGNRITVSAQGNVFTIRFETEDGGYNIIEADAENKTVRVTESNCSLHKDCTYTAPIKSNSSPSIVCTPHSLVIVPLKFEDSGIIG